MTLSNNELVGKCLGILKSVLGPFVWREMKSCYGKRWLSQIERKLSDNQLANFRREGGGEEAFLAVVDIDSLLKLMNAYYYKVFFHLLGHNAHSYVGELRGVRHDWAHQQPFSVDQTRRALETMVLLLKSVGAEPEAEKVDKHRKEVLRQPSESNGTAAELIDDLEKTTDGKHQATAATEQTHTEGRHVDAVRVEPETEEVNKHREAILRQLFESDERTRERHRSAAEQIDAPEKVTDGKDPATAKPRTIEVPNLIGQELPQARGTLANTNLELGSIHRVPSDTTATDRITKQNPTAGTKAKRGSVVRVWVSSGSSTVEVPDLIGKNFVETGGWLASVDLKLGDLNKAPSDEAPKGEIIGQHPIARTKVKLGSPVNITVSSGRWYERILANKWIDWFGALNYFIGPIVAGIEIVFVALQLLGIVELSIPWWLWLLAPGMIVVGGVWGERPSWDISTWLVYLVAPMMSVGAIFALLGTEASGIVVPFTLWLWLLLLMVINGVLMFFLDR